MNNETYHQTFQIPGTQAVLHAVRSTAGRLLELRCGERVYVDEQSGGRCLYLRGGPVVITET